MKLHFKLQFFTKWGQKLLLLTYAADNTALDTYQMEPDANGYWHFDFDYSTHRDFAKYRYAVNQPDNTFMYETGLARTLQFPVNGLDIALHDNWRGPFGDTPFNAALFTNLFFARETTDISTNGGRLILRLHCPAVEPDKYIALTGNQPLLGNWGKDGFIRMDETHFPDWHTALAVNEITFPLEYKYLLVDATTHTIAEWEGGENHSIAFADDSTLNVVNDENFRRNSTPWKAAGVAIPVFSLRSKKSFGVGEFDDLRLMIDWAAETGQRMIQTLPVNDTILHRNNRDSYPYNAVSVYALHPLYLNPYRAGKLKNDDQRKYYEQQRKALNSLPIVAYQEVMELKWAYLSELYEQEGTAVFRKKDFKQFFDSNKEWLVPYAAFSYLRDLYGTPDTQKWDTHQSYSQPAIEDMCAATSEVYPKIAFYYFLQYHLHKQLSEVHAYAQSKKVALKGDIPIGVSPQSVDVWVEPELFNLHVQAGAPPDDFSATGQNWGFPTYNWELMAKDGFNWWKKRFAKMADYFDAYRIDHILGFFRIWEIPSTDVWGLKGYFNPALPYSVDEIRYKGIDWDEQRLTKPYITDELLQNIFGNSANAIKEQFLLKNSDETLYFRPEFDTQRKIKRYFAASNSESENNSVILRDGLYSLHCEQLFIADEKKPGYYHPRISMCEAYSFRSLNSEQQQRLRELHDDYFYRRHNDFWKENAYAKLPALLSATGMLVCGEDLGMVPDSVPEVMKSLEILSLEIQRMPKKYGQQFGLPADAPYLSVVTTSTHDMTPLRAWWKENSALTQRFYNDVLQREGAAPEKCEADIAKAIVKQHLESGAMWVILPWQDWIAMDEKLWREKEEDERINVPDNPRNFWCYRMHIGLEEMMKKTEFNEEMRRMIGEVRSLQ